MTSGFLKDGDDIYWRRGFQEDQSPLERDGMVVLVGRVFSSSVLEQVEIGMPVCHPKKLSSSK